MNDAGETGTCIMPNPLPHAHDVATRCIHDMTSFCSKRLHRRRLCTERRNDHNVTFRYFVDISLFHGAGQKLYSEASKVVIDIRVVYHLSKQVNTSVGEHVCSCVGQINSPLHTMT